MLSTLNRLFTVNFNRFSMYLIVIYNDVTALLYNNMKQTWTQNISNLLQFCNNHQSQINLLDRHRVRGLQPRAMKTFAKFGNNRAEEIGFKLGKIFAKDGIFIEHPPEFYSSCSQAFLGKHSWPDSSTFYWRTKTSLVDVCLNGFQAQIFLLLHSACLTRIWSSICSKPRCWSFYLMSESI